MPLYLFNYTLSEAIVKEFCFRVPGIVSHQWVSEHLPHSRLLGSVFVRYSREKRFPLLGAR